MQKSGKIVLSNSVGEGVSEGNFTIEYPAPTISSTGMPTEIEMGNKLLISGFPYERNQCCAFYS